MDSVTSQYWDVLSSFVIILLAFGINVIAMRYMSLAGAVGKITYIRNSSLTNRIVFSRTEDILCGFPYGKHFQPFLPLRIFIQNNEYVCFINICILKPSLIAKIFQNKQARNMFVSQYKFSNHLLQFEPSIKYDCYTKFYTIVYKRSYLTPSHQT